MIIANELGGDLSEVYMCLSDSEDWGDTLNVLLYDENGEDLEIDDIDLSPAEGKPFALVLGYDEEEAFFAYVEQQ